MMNISRDGQQGSGEPRAFFVTGTDTGVGKTRVAASLLAAARVKGFSTAAMKPVASGCEEINGVLRNEDALLLQHYCSPSLPYEQINPVALRAAIATHLAAAAECSAAGGICPGNSDGAGLADDC
jgi:dethiobiotin synthetase